MSPEFTTDPHERLAAHLDAAPLGAPRAPELMAILRTLFSPAEAELAARLPFAPVGVAQLAQELDRPSEELGLILAGLADRGLCFERQTPRGAYYGLLPVVPGLAETQFVGGVVNDEKRRLARLFADYYGKGPGPALVAAGQRGTALPRVIPVGRAVAADQEILPFEQAETVLRQADYICVGTCYCRQEAELNGHGCGAPKDVCLTFGPFAEFLVGKGLAQPADFKAAMRVMERAEMAGLVHVTANAAKDVKFICNCCGCCCLFLKTVTQLKRPGAIAAAGWLAVVDPDNCVACGQCQEVCQVGAPQPLDETMAVDASLCLGCGHCALACPTGAIAMQPRPRRQAPPFASFMELTAAISQGRTRKKVEEGHA